MELTANELIKLLLSKRNLTQTELAAILTQKTGKKYTQAGLSRKLSKGTIAYNEMLYVIDVLGYEIEIKNKN